MVVSSLIAQGAPSGMDPLQWVGSLGTPALIGVLLYYLVTKALPEMQNRFHQSQEELRKSYDLRAEAERKTFNDTIDRIVTTHERTAERIVDKIDTNRCKAAEAK